MNRERLERLITVLEYVRDNRKPFNMAKWVDVATAPLNCNTAAGAIGWACRDPWFNNQGLVLSKDDSEFLYYVPTYNGYNNFEAIEVFFDIEHDEANYIAASILYFKEEWRNDCHWENYITVDMVIEHVKELLAKE